MKTRIKKLNEQITKGDWQGFATEYLGISELPNKIKARVEEMEKTIAQQYPGFRFQPGEVDCTPADQISVNLLGEDGFNPLMCAAKSNQLKMVTALLTGTINVANNGEVVAETKTEQKNNDAQTVIVVQPVLLKADPNARNKHGITALDIAIEKGYVDIVNVLLAHGARYNTSSLRLAIAMGNMSIVKLLVPKLTREEIDRPDQYGGTALHDAIAKNNPDAVSILLAAGASYKAKKPFIYYNHQSDRGGDHKLHSLEQVALRPNPLPLFKAICEAIKEQKDSSHFLTTGLIQLLKQTHVDNESVKYLLEQNIQWDHYFAPPEPSLGMLVAARANIHNFLKFLEKYPSLIKAYNVPSLLQIILVRLVQAKEEKGDYQTAYLRAIDQLLPAEDLDLTLPVFNIASFKNQEKDLSALVMLVRHIAETGRDFEILKHILQRSSGKVVTDTMWKIFQICLPKTSKFTNQQISEVVISCHDAKVLEKILSADYRVPLRTPELKLLTKQRILILKQRLLDEEKRVFDYTSKAPLLKSPETKMAPDESKTSIALSEPTKKEITDLLGGFPESKISEKSQAYSTKKLELIFDSICKDESKAVDNRQLGSMLEPFFGTVREMRAYEVLFGIRSKSNNNVLQAAISPAELNQQKFNALDTLTQLFPLAPKTVNTLISKLGITSFMWNPQQTVVAPVEINKLRDAESLRNAATILDLYFYIEHCKAGKPFFWGNSSLKAKHIAQHEKVFVQLLCYLTKPEFRTRKDIHGTWELPLADGVQVLSQISRGLEKNTKPYHFANMLENLFVLPAIKDPDGKKTQAMYMGSKIQYLQEQYAEFKSFMELRFPARWQEMMHEVEQTAKATASPVSQTQPTVTQELPSVHASPLAAGVPVTPVSTVPTSGVAANSENALAPR